MWRHKETLWSFVFSVIFLGGFGLSQYVLSYLGKIQVRYWHPELDADSCAMFFNGDLVALTFSISFGVFLVSLVKNVQKWVISKTLPSKISRGLYASLFVSVLSAILLFSSYTCVTEDMIIVRNSPFSEERLDPMSAINARFSAIRTTKHGGRNGLKFTIFFPTGKEVTLREHRFVLVNSFQSGMPVISDLYRKLEAGGVVEKANAEVQRIDFFQALVKKGQNSQEDKLSE
jgi:hypothetical protein